MGAQQQVAERASMATVVVDKTMLRKQLVTNRDAHRTAFEQAIQGYRNRAIELLEEHIDRIRTGSVERVEVMLPIPEDHTDDYDRAIANLDWTVFDTVELAAREFDQYVRDSWAWKHEFARTTALYTTAS